MNELHQTGRVASFSAQQAWDGSQTTVVYGGRRRHGLRFSSGVAIAAIVGARYPTLALADAALDEAAEMLVNWLKRKHYVNSCD